MDLERRWLGAWSALGTGAPDRSLFAELLRRYAEPHRAYHTLEHIRECFLRLDEVPALAQRPAEVELAIWFHDAVYQTRGTDNEAASAAWAGESVLALGAPAEVAARIEDLIMATKHDAPPPGGDAALVVDIDLAILGAPADRFEAYDAQIRQEYSWVPLADFQRARRTILEGFAARPAIFTTEPFRQRYETRARANIRRVLDSLNHGATVNPQELPPMSDSNPSFLGLRTMRYTASDLAAAKAWYQSVLGVAPYFDEPFYVGFSVKGFELGITPDPDARKERPESGVGYWGVEDAEAAYRQLVSLGASDHEPVQDVGGEIKIGAVRDPFGNILGVVENPHFRLE